jgi:tRNA pseudouridine55 synthase
MIRGEPSVKRVRKIVDGVLLVDKPVGPSSNAVLQHVRHLYSAATAGHTGTLDPLASGLLPICFGDATKFGAHLLNADKGYIADIRLGVRTSTADAEGEVLDTRPVPFLIAESEALRTVLEGFLGESLQVPPMHSALKIDGQPLYKLARKGLTAERTPRRIAIHSLDLIDCQGELLRIQVYCSKGTYIRVLAEDIGSRLGCGAHLASLRRVRVGSVDVAEAVTVSSLEGMAAEERQRQLLPVDYLVSALTRLDLPLESAGRFSHGQKVETQYLSRQVQVAEMVRVFDADGMFLGVGSLGPDHLLVPRRLRRQVAGVIENPSVSALPN